MDPKAYVQSLDIPPVAPGFAVSATRSGAADKPADMHAAVNAGSIVSFVDGLDAGEKEDVLYSTQLAQRAASARFDRFAETRDWYRKYLEVLENVGWIAEQLAFSEYDEAEGQLKMDAAAIKVIAAIASANQLLVLQNALSALESLADGNRQIVLFDEHCAADLSGNFQIGTVERSDNGALAMALGAFYFTSSGNRGRFLFFSWGAGSISFWTSAQKMTLNRDVYARARDTIKSKLGSGVVDYVDTIQI